MTQKQTHTPTPWRVDMFATVRGLNHERLTLPSIESGNDDVQKANAAHIVKCVNEYEGLVEVADWVVTARLQGHPINDALVNKAKAALSKARGEG